MSTNVGSIHYDLDLDTKKFESAAARAGGGVKKFAQVATVALAAVATATVAFGASSVKAYMEAEKAQKQTEAILKSTGKAAGVTAKMVTNLASAFQKTTPYADEVVQSAENMLLTFTNIGKDIFPDTTATVLDMATAMGSDLQSTAIQVGKALQDPVLGATALQRVGVRLTKSQKDLIQSLVDVGDKAGAQKIILKELQTEFGGSAKAAGETFAGKLEILKNKFGDVQESIGLVILNALSPFMDKVSKFVSSDKFQAWIEKLNTWLSVNIPPTMDYITNILFPALWEMLKKIGPVIGEILKGFSDLVVWFSKNEWAFWAIVAVFVAIKTAMFLKGALDVFTGVMAGAKLAYSSMAAVVSAPIAIVILTAAALAAIAGVVVAANTAREAMANAGIAMQGSMKTANSITAAGNKAKAAGNTAKAKELYRIANTLRASTKQNAQNLVKSTSNPIDNFFTGLKVLFHAKGTDFHPGGMAIVGERGPELVNLPRGSQVIPNDKLGKMGSTTTANFTGNIYLGDSGAVDNFFARLSRNSELASKGMALL